MSRLSGRANALALLLAIVGWAGAACARSAMSSGLEQLRAFWVRAAAEPPSPPQPGRIVTLGAREVGCDNGLNCREPADFIAARNDQNESVPQP
ncbi:hypothetical protein [Sphingomonas bacterium]|uniref:hypothetical protein n=1 Tax=Sphingomonas bacterium TaxID=1895847 RepID=UPI00262397BE|nr:hypothetical protein [Sphingomonas bacterium]